MSTKCPNDWSVQVKQGACDFQSSLFICQHMDKRSPLLPYSSKTLLTLDDLLCTSLGVQSSGTIRSMSPNTTTIRSCILNAVGFRTPNRISCQPPSLMHRDKTCQAMMCAPTKKQSNRASPPSTMCIAFFGYDLDPNLPSFILASNRDEFWSRPTLPLHIWPEENDPATTPASSDSDASSEPILAGRDMERGGTWLGITYRPKDVRLALLTNVREPVEEVSPQSRGDLVTNFLTSANSVQEFLAQDLSPYAGFNLVVGSREMGYFFISNRGPTRLTHLQPGRIYGMCNGQLNEPWPKLARGVQMLQKAVDEEKNVGKPNTDCEDSSYKSLKEKLWKILTDEWKPNPADLPDTGIDKEFEYVLSSIFVQGPSFDYGTRCSTLVLETPHGWQVEERTYQQKQDDKTQLLNPRQDFELRSIQF